MAQCQQAADYAHSQGKKYIAYSFSTGNPGQAEWNYIAQHGFSGADYLGLGEYWGGQAFTLGNALRHRQVDQWIGTNHPPFVIIECGRDAVEGEAVGGWVAQGISPTQYVGELEQYDTLLQQDGDVLGGTIFTAGAAGGQWTNFDIDSLVDDLLSGAPPPPKGGLPFQWWLLAGAGMLVGGVLLIQAISQNGDGSGQVLAIPEGTPIPAGYRVVGYQE